MSQTQDYSLSMPVVYTSEFPTTEDLCQIPENSCLVFDDLIEECVFSKTIDYLFRVLSRKKRLHVIIMSQTYYPKGRYTISIRNCSDYHVLMRNSDESITRRVATSLGLKTEIIKATEINSGKLHSYIFVDRTNQARVNNLEVYVDVLSRIRIAVRKSMKFYLLAEQDFKQCFTVKDCDLAEYANTKIEKSDTTNTSTDTEKRRRDRHFIKRQIKRALH